MLVYLMKILTGSLRGRGILFKPNPHLRPTGDKVRKAIFDLLRGEIEGKRVLDLFSGTGALGLEALSNGASWVTFVEANRAQAVKIRQNLAKLGVPEKAWVLRKDVFEAMEYLSRKGEAYDVVFLDPPYGGGLAGRVLEALSQAPFLGQGAFVVLECHKKELIQSPSGRLKAIQTKVYGDTRLVVYR
ncbi:MAG: 16S rRNA (guanine(966)-N(2))-methyltransferase RsmD [Candidatus Omnitrophica bacterium]|nr:16S rRNA (guanine(966)-N(2))-methyltransferase RsmD [Candidatus Omnitrophota bacterium]